MLILTSYVRNLLEGAARAGADPSQLLQGAGISPASGASTTVTIPQFVSLVRTTTHVLDDEALGLLEHRQRVGTFAIIAAHASHAPSLGEAFGRCAEFMDLLDNSFALSFRERGRDAIFELSPIAGRRVMNELATEMILVLVHRLLGWLAGVRLPINRVNLQYQRPEHGDNYKHLFAKAPFFFGAGSSSIHIPASFMARPILRSEDQAMAWARRTPLDAFLPQEAVSGLALEVATAIEAYLDEHGAIPEARHLSDQLGMAPHTLRRRLQAEGVDYRSVRSQVRRDRSTRLLNTTNQSIEEIADLTGFSEASAFIRAFRGWTGMTPRHYRIGENH